MVGENFPKNRIGSKVIFSHLVVLCAMTITAVILDQVSKWVVSGWMPEGHSLTLLPGVLDLQLHHNPYGAFGLFANFPPSIRPVVLIALTVLAMLAIFTLSIRTLGWRLSSSVSLGLILGGAFSNLADRAIRGEVLDFLHLQIGDHLDTPTFNVADVSISIGSLMLVGVLLYSWIKQIKNRDSLESQ